jgi:hypothetical protein
LSPQDVETVYARAVDAEGFAAVWATFVIAMNWETSHF